MKPNFFLIGAQRAGTTTIHNALKAHPEIFMSAIKEPQYYVAQMLLQKAQLEPEVQKEYETYLGKGKYRTTETYESLFNQSDGYKIVGESSHYIYRPEVARIIYKDCPNAKILISIRNPVDRFFSEYQLAKRTGNYSMSFADYYRENKEFAMGKNKLEKGFYASKIRHFIDVFGSDNVKLIIFDDFKVAPMQTLTEILDWLGVNPAYELPIVNVQMGGTIKNAWVSYFLKHQGINKVIKAVISSGLLRNRLRQLIYKKTVVPEKMDSELRKELATFYSSEITALEVLLGKSLNSWKSINP